MRPQNETRPHSRRVQESTRFEDLPDVLTVREVATLLRISRNSVYEALRTGEIPSVRLRRRYVIPKHQLQNLLGIQPTENVGVGAVDSQTRSATDEFFKVLGDALRRLLERHGAGRTSEASPESSA